MPFHVGQRVWLDQSLKKTRRIEWTPAIVVVMNSKSIRVALAEKDHDVWKWGSSFSVTAGRLRNRTEAIPELHEA